MIRNTKIGAAALVVIAFLGGVGFMSSLGAAVPRIEIVNTAVIATPTTPASLSQLEPIELAILAPVPGPTETTRPIVTSTPLPTLTATTVLATPTSSPTQGPLAANNANLRSGPDTAYPRVGAVVASQALKACGNTWIQGMRRAMWGRAALVMGRVHQS